MRNRLPKLLNNLPASVGSDLLSNSLKLLVDGLTNRRDQQARREAMQQEHQRQCQRAEQARQHIEAHAQQQQNDLRARVHCFDQTLRLIETEQCHQNKNSKQVRKTLQALQERLQSPNLPLEERAMLYGAQVQLSQQLTVFSDQSLQYTQTVSRMQLGSMPYAEPLRLAHYEGN